MTHERRDDTAAAAVELPLYKVFRLADELTDSIDCRAEDIGGTRDPQTILRKLGSACDEARITITTSQAPASGVPPGWQLVPKDPSEEDLDRMVGALNNDCWQAMLTASPSPPPFEGETPGPVPLTADKTMGEVTRKPETDPDCTEAQAGVQQAPSLKSTTSVSASRRDEPSPTTPQQWKLGDPRCDQCDNGLEPKWEYCAWCGQHLVADYPSHEVSTVKPTPPLDTRTIERCAAVEVEPDVATVADAKNQYQEGYAVGFQDCEVRMRSAIRSLRDTSEGEEECPLMAAAEKERLIMLAARASSELVGTIQPVPNGERK